MPRKRKKQNGVGANCRCLKRFLHPRAIVDAKYPNATQQERLDGLVAIRREEKAVNRVQKWCVVFRHDDFPNQELHCSERYAVVQQEGAEADYFQQVQVDNNQEDAAVEQEENAIETPNVGGSDLQENINRLRDEGYDVDDDNDPAPENVPPANPPPQEAEAPSLFGEWDSCPNICHRTSAGLFQENPKLKKDVNQSSNIASYIDYYLYFLPTTYLKMVLIKETNAQDDKNPITWGELLVYIGIWLLMATTVAGCDRRCYWENSPISPWKGAPYRFNEYMNYTRFEHITRNLTFTNIPFPNFRDKFHEVRLLIAAFNQHMSDVFIPSWVSCLDESMSIWTSRWTCPGWMYVPRKPHPQGNEYHTIACGVSGILYAIELVEGKDCPPQREKPRFHEKGKTASLLLRLCQSIFQTGKVVILDSGFCVLQALVELKKMGVYASALVKKRRYWPKNVPGESIKSDFEDVDIGVTKRKPGELDGEKIDLFCLKEPDYVMTLMSTYGTVASLPDQKESLRVVDGEVKRFKYNVVVGNHYRYRDSVDAHNSKRHDCGTKHGLSIEETWKTTRWPCRVFAFVLSVAEVNAYLAMVFFGDYSGSQWEFRKKLAYELIHNPYDTDGASVDGSSRCILRSDNDHRLITAPAYSKFEGGEWKNVYRMEYQQHKCMMGDCKKRIRTVCTCSKHIWRCNKCFIKHCIDCNSNTLLEN